MVPRDTFTALCTLALLLCVLCVTGVRSATCEAVIPTASGVTYKYDLAALTQASTDTTKLYQGTANRFKLWANVCGEASVGCNPVAAVCQEDTQRGVYYSVGFKENQIFVPYVNSRGDELPGSGVGIRYVGATKCASGSHPALATLYAQCSSNVEGAVVTNVTEVSPCQFVMHMLSKHACPTSVSTGDTNAINKQENLVAGIVIGIAIVLTFVLGFAVYYVVKRKRRADRLGTFSHLEPMDGANSSASYSIADPDDGL